MIRLLFTRFWPVFIPFVIYFGWMGMRYWMLKKRGEAPLFSELITRTPLFYTSLASLLTLLGCFLWLGLSQPSETSGHYVPAHQENGKIVSGHVEP